MPDTVRKPAPPHCFDTVEGRRLRADGAEGWRTWGPYVSERQWGTVREDYSANGDAWNYLPHDYARSHAYRWGEDGIAGFSDDQQFWCLSLALWNGRDPILKERMFGLTNREGSHGEDVKELWWYLDGVPTHAYMRSLYKYPQAAFPYAELLAESRRRMGGDLPEYELVDTGIFRENRYFDVEVEYAKAAPDDILMRVTVTNRGPDADELHLLPQLSARNIWSWDDRASRPQLRQEGETTVAAEHPVLPPMRFWTLQPAEFLFCENETNTARLFGVERPGPFKDGINDHLVGGRPGTVNPQAFGTKCAALAKPTLQAGASARFRYRFSPADAAPIDAATFDRIVADRIADADEFYAAIQDDIVEPDAKAVQRQAFAGMLWSKQFYNFDVREWLAGDPAEPAPPATRRHGRNSDWTHLRNAEIISMPDKWEYPWYAAWDLAFHCLTFALIDPEFAKAQLTLLTRESYMHPNGQLPAYEWDFGDVNPPVHAAAALRIYEIDAALTGKGDRDFLARMFHKVSLNFTWWVNRKDAAGRNIFQGGFLGLDNIGVFDRSRPLPTGGYISQSDGTAWMAMYTLNLLQMALILAEDEHVYEDMAAKFFEHFLLIAGAMTNVDGPGSDGASGLWDEEDGFFYDDLNLPDGSRAILRVRSLVGLIPLCAVSVSAGEIGGRFPDFRERVVTLLKARPDLASLISRWGETGRNERTILSLLRTHRLKALLSRMLDETEFLSDYGIRSVSKAHLAAPFVYETDGSVFLVDYEPRESRSRLFGGNSNWRGPIWMPINFLLIEALYEFEKFYEPSFRIECPTGSGQFLQLSEVAAEIAARLTRIFLRGEAGRRPVFGDQALFQDDPAFRDCIPFNEYFDGDTGAGLGASHQTGWTGLVALLIQPRKRSAGRLVPTVAAPVGADPKPAPA